MQSGSLSDEVTDFVFKYIHDNRLNIGDTLPSELQTCANLTISRGIVREAFNALRVLGIVEVGNGRPPKVGAVSNALLTHLLRHALSTQQVQPRQLLDLCSSIEVRSVEVAARRRDKRLIRELRTSVDGMNTSIANPKNFDAWDLRFHRLINGATGNALAELISTALHECLAETIQSSRMPRRSRAELVNLVEIHLLIVDAIETRGASKAVALVKKHYVVGKRVLRSCDLRNN